MDTEILRGEIERLFELEDMIALARDVLGLVPDKIGGTGSKASFARALVDHHAQIGGIETLIDAVGVLRKDIDGKVRDMAMHAKPAVLELQSGATLGNYAINRKLGEGPSGATYVAHRDGRPVIMKVINQELASNAHAMLRFSTAVRLAARVQHEGVPAGLMVEAVDGHQVMSYDQVESQSLAARTARSGPMHINEAKGILGAILEVLAALHAARIVHGNLKLENILVERGAEAGKHRVVLIDGALDRLRVLRRPSANLQDVFVVVGQARTMSPEQVRGERTGTRSDVYSFGAVMYEILTGKPLFMVKPGVDFAVAHLSGTPVDAAAAAPRGWVNKEVSAFIMRLLSRDPMARPADAQVVLDELEKLSRGLRTVRKAEPTISEEELSQRVDAFIGAPEEAANIAALDDALEQGADAGKVAQAYAMAAETMTEDEHKEARKALLARAARMYDAAENFAGAEKVLESLWQLDPSDQSSFNSLVALRKQLGKFDELIEMLVGRAEEAEDAEDRARLMAEIGRIYAEETKDPGQASVAYAQAYCEAPSHEEYADALEKAAGGDMAILGEAIGTLAEATTAGEMAPEDKNRLFVRLGNWYVGKLGRPDAALPCFQAVIATDPTNDTALDGMASLFRSKQQYTELGQVLLRRAESATNPTRARDFRCEAAELLESRLNETAKARELFEQILQADPGHVKATDALLRFYEKDGNVAGRVKILDGRAQALGGERRAAALVKIGEILERDAKDAAEAAKRFEAALADDPKNMDALKALDAIYTRTGKAQELLSTLQRTADAAQTPRQRIGVLERIAKFLEQEFLDHDKAAQALEQILEIDPANEAALLTLVRHYRALDRWQQVVDVYDRHLKIATDKNRRIDLLLDKARVLIERLGAQDVAMNAYEQVLENDPHHAGALESLASLREQSGDAEAALKAIDALAAKAETGKEKAEHYIRAAKLLEGRDDKDGAIAQYRAALEANPREAVASAALRTLYLERGEAAQAIELLQREMEFAETNANKGRIAAEAAKLVRDRLKDSARAETIAKEALGYDPSQIDALVLLADAAYEAARYVEVIQRCDNMFARLETLAKPVAIRTLRQFVDSLRRSEDLQRAISYCDQLRQLGQDDQKALEVVAGIEFEHGDPAKALAMYQELLDKHGATLFGAERGQVLYRHGEAARRAGDATTAIKSLSEAADMDASAADPLIALAKVYESKGDWNEVIRVKNRRMDVASDDERIEQLTQIADIYASKLNDRVHAAASIAAALELKPDDRKLLMNLMQLYMANKEWTKLVDTMIKFAGTQTDSKQKALYLYNAAKVLVEQLQDADSALEHFEAVFALDPGMEKALEDAIAIRLTKDDHLATEKLLKIRLDRVVEKENRELILKTFDELATLYHQKLEMVSEAIDAYEAAQELDPDNKVRNDKLAVLYAANPEQYLDKAVAAQQSALDENPQNPAPYQTLCKLYTDARRPDSAWCLCQALVVLGMADTKEKGFYERMRSETAAAAREVASGEDWMRRIMHENADPILTAILASIEPAILATRTDTLENLGYGPHIAIDLATNTYALPQTIFYACGVLGMDAPPTFENTNDPGLINFLHAQTPAIVLGRAAFEVEVAPQAAAFIVGRHLAYYRPGLYVRHLVPTGTGLKAWVFAAIRLSTPQFPISADIEGPVNENLKALAAHLSGPAREMLASLVVKLLQAGGALDLKRWVSGVDMTADRVGFLLAHDLKVATEIIGASDEASSSIGHADRLKELVMYSIGESYFALRQKLGIAVDSE